MMIHGNDLFSPLYVFWKVLKERSDELQKKVQSELPITKEKFIGLRKDILNMKDELEIATAYYIVNRCSFSGSTFCGGFSKQSASDRLNQSAINKLTKISTKNLILSNLDCNVFLKSIDDREETIIYADPPYYIETYIYGKDGDMHEGFNHQAFAVQLKKHKSWILSYNDCSYIRMLYADCKIECVKWSYGMSIKPSSEVVITPPLAHVGRD